MISFNGEKRYNDYSSFIKQRFSRRVQKISLHTGFTCPNRDGSKGFGGCTYCNNKTFNPNYCHDNDSIVQQLTDGIAFFSKKYQAQKYLAYFQSYTNTYADIEQLRQMYATALSHPDVVGMIIGTRPDCINEDIIDMLSDFADDFFVSLEFGIESTLNRTLDAVNRCHTFEETQAAFACATNKGLHLGGHIILGLPGESRTEILDHACRLSELPLHSLKMHHLQIVKDTILAQQFAKEPDAFELFQSDEYIDFITTFLSLLRPDIVIDRFISEAPRNLLIAPQWNGLKNFEVLARIDKKLLEKDLWQGKHYQTNLQ